MHIIKKNKFLLLLGIVALLLPLFVHSKFHLNTLILLLLFATIAGAWNILGGYGGQLSLGHTIFFGLGAYTSSLLYLNYGTSPWIGLIAAAAISIAAGIFIGWPTFRLKGPYFTLATIAFAEVIRLLCLYWRDLTKGSMGINIRFEPGLSNLIFREYSSYYYFALVLFLISLAIVYWVDRTRVGYYLKAIREDEDSAETLGINVTKYKMIAMVISAGLTGVAGVLYAQFMLFFEPESVFNLNFSIEIALIAIVGGMGTVYGPLLGAAIIVPLNEILRSSFPALSGMNYFIYGIVLVLIVSFMPNGLMPVLKRIPKKFKSRKKVQVSGSRKKTAS
ncbi:branched-chain amino acid ABC transporter permease [Peribacillus glennii]|uniref:Branched-chain amino acid ABC transporter permease n=1 Tax=Peribacillus glennii TaxID=2303991 RepID=A0A372LFR5_9BACI|nr:branched-chain amino acid ABC transporter permease [Peribacillus glennii]RFU64822.1 branched-chain amino acid ABC transporter permease [Peribacillus glennii]